MYCYNVSIVPTQGMGFGEKTQTYLLTQRFMGNMPVIIYHFIENSLLLSMLTSHRGMITFRIHRPTIRNMALIKIYTNISFEFNNFVLMKDKKHVERWKVFTNRSNIELETRQQTRCVN